MQTLVWGACGCFWKRRNGEKDGKKQKTRMKVSREKWTERREISNVWTTKQLFFMNMRIFNTLERLLHLLIRITNVPISSNKLFKLGNRMAVKLSKNCLQTLIILSETYLLLNLKTWVIMSWNKPSNCELGSSSHAIN